MASSAADWNHLTPDARLRATQGFVSSKNLINPPGESWGWAAPAAEIWSTSNDLTLFLQAIMAAASDNETDPDVIKARADLSLDPIVARAFVHDILFTNVDDKGDSWGFTWEAASVNYDSTVIRLMTKGGAMDGFRSEVAIVPDLRLSCAILINNQAGLSDLAKKVVTTLLSGLLPEVDSAYSPPIEAPPPRNPSSYVGTYLNKWNESASISLSHAYRSVTLVLFLRITYKNGMFDSLLRSSINPSDPTVLQLTSMERNNWDCSNEEITSYDGEFALFEFNSLTGFASNVTFPGFNYGVIFTRVDQ
jgi:hypothetical protein